MTTKHVYETFYGHSPEVWYRHELCNWLKTIKQTSIYYSYTKSFIPLPYECRWVAIHDDVIKWKPFPRYWPFVYGVHRWPVSSPHQGQWREALIFFFDLRLYKRLSKQWRGWWFETPSRPLWRHCNMLGILSWYPSIFVNRMQLIWGSVTGRFHLRVHDLHMSYSELTGRHGARPPIMATSATGFIITHDCIHAWITNYTHCKVWHEIIYPCPSFNGLMDK